MKNFLLSFSLYALAISIMAAEEQSDVPQPPYVAPAPQKVEWVITYTYEQNSIDAKKETSSDGKASPKITQIKAAHSDEIRKETTYWSDNSTTEEWYVADVLIEHQPTWRKDFYLARKVGRDPKDDFLMSWINASYFKGRETKSGHDCYLFEAPNSVVLGKPYTPLSNTDATKLSPDYQNLIASQEAEAKALASLTTKVWIDKRSHLPVESYSDGVKKEFVFTKTAPDLGLPPPYKKEYEKLKNMYPMMFNK